MAEVIPSLYPKPWEASPRRKYTDGKKPPKYPTGIWQLLSVFQQPAWYQSCVKMQILHSVTQCLSGGKTTFTTSDAHRGQTGKGKRLLFSWVQCMIIFSFPQRNRVSLIFFQNSLAFNSALRRDKGPEIHFSLCSEVSANTSAKSKGHSALESGTQEGAVGPMAKRRARAPRTQSSQDPGAPHCCLVSPQSTAARYGDFSSQKMET